MISKLIYRRGKEPFIAHALSRAFVHENAENIERDKEIAAQVNLIVQQNEIGDALLNKIKDETAKDEELSKLSQMIQTGWPNHNKKVNDKIRFFCKHKSELTTTDGIIYKDQAILIPKSRRAQILSKIHCSHLCKIIKK